MLSSNMTASYRQLSAAIAVAAAFALVPLLGSTASPPVSLPTPPAVGTPALPPVQLPAAGIGLPEAVATGCNRVAAPSGSDRARGGLKTPFRTVQALVNSLRPGQTGCLREGTYTGAVRIARGGRRRARVTLAAYPGETATVVGRLQIVKGANYVTVTGLRLDGENPQRGAEPDDRREPCDVQLRRRDQ